MSDERNTNGQKNSLKTIVVFAQGFTLPGCYSITPGYGACMFLGVCLLTQSVAPTTKEVPLSKAVIGPPCVLQADGY
jgi:hypothetical protein